MLFLSFLIIWRCTKVLLHDFLKEMDRWMDEFNKVWVDIILLYKLILCRKNFGKEYHKEESTEIPKISHDLSI